MNKKSEMASATTPAYRTVTILALLVGMTLLIFMAVMSNQNERKWSVVDTAKQMIVGPFSQLGIGYPGVAGTSASLLLNNALGANQFSMYTIGNPTQASTPPYFTITSPTGRIDVPLPPPK